MRLVIFGANGQLGRELTRASWPQSVEVAVFTREQASIVDPEQVRACLAAPDVGCVVNAAAYTAVDRAESETEAAFAINRDGARTLAQASAERGVPLIHVSTDYVFDGQKPGAYVEDDAVSPTGVYGASKAAGEAEIRATLKQHFILRTSWVFSAFGANFVKTMLRLARERDELRVVADQFGRPTATRDLAAAIVRIVARQREGSAVFGTYHFAGAGRASWHELASAVVAEQQPYTGRSPRVLPISSAEYPTPARRPANSELDTTRYEQTFGERPHSWREGLAEVVRELLGANPAI
jgi:dTDP-4-dehydrorhamnose reductase